MAECSISEHSAAENRTIDGPQLGPYVRVCAGLPYSLTFRRFGGAAAAISHIYGSGPFIDGAMTMRIVRRILCWFTGGHDSRNTTEDGLTTWSCRKRGDWLAITG